MRKAQEARTPPPPSSLYFLSNFVLTDHQLWSNRAEKSDFASKRERRGRKLASRVIGEQETGSACIVACSYDALICDDDSRRRRSAAPLKSRQSRLELEKCLMGLVNISTLVSSCGEHRTCLKISADTSFTRNLEQFSKLGRDRP